ncbi:FadR family transcriptional regulator [Pseudarthrobacter sp. R1]|uniref:FadR/GntR family transcriptional regulator n=1 Tax=Pseudarthrobacter sp. R1 TaxID=2944934 RepID=UPI002109FC98|nr:FadR/GntR family transcriptional regulator [Pseudarthrobacter sp. R1]MCQ6273355.1 FadR family transcriptional regulator [Pseudarthrobacter sp. R1]
MAMAEPLDFDGPATFQLTNSSRRPKRLAQAIVDDLLGRIIRGELPAGTVLPPETELGSGYDVSRTVTREAIKSLEDKGVVRAKQGLGTTVSPAEEWNILDPGVLALAIRYDKDLRVQTELSNLRVALEGQMAAQAATQATAEDVGELRAIITQMAKETSNPKTYLDLDFEFHGTIMRISGSWLTRRIVRNIHEQVRKQLHWVPAQSAELTETHAEHVAIFEAISRNDPAEAQFAVTQHIQNAWSRRRDQLQKVADKVFS